MLQTNTSVVLEVVPESTGKLLTIIDKMKDDLHVNKVAGETYGKLKYGVPTLHFMSASVFQDGHYDPLLMIEVNFDGPAGPFWAQLEATIGSYLLDMIRCCKRPADRTGPLYDAVTRTQIQRSTIAPYLEAKAIPASVAHQGNRGLYRQRILDEEVLFKDARNELAANPGSYRGKTGNETPEAAATRIHAALRQALNTNGRLDAPVSPRIPLRETLTDVARFLCFTTVVLYVLSIPGIALVTWLRAFFPTWERLALGLLFLVPVIVVIVLYLTRKPRPGEGAPAKGPLLSFEREFASLGNPLTLIVLVLCVFAIALLSIAGVATVGKTLIDCIRSTKAACFATSFMPTFWDLAWIALVGFYTIFTVSLPLIVAWLRWLELRDSHHDAPPANLAELRKMTRREDWVPQNHMGSAVIVKPGVLRMALFRAGHLGLGLLLRLAARDGYLGSMRTVHFAHWLFVNNGSRLIFFSNFDLSWDSYLDDFIEKAHNGLTLAWGSCIGFPATRFLILDGASHGRQFKQWARHSMAVSRFWFSAYRDLTVNQIERNARIAEGLRSKELTGEKALAWARDL